MKFRIFSAQHVEMADLAKAILAHATTLAHGTQTSGEDPLPALRLAFSRTVAVHCSDEIDALRDHLVAHPQVAAERADLIRRFHDELLAWRGQLMECNAHWPAKQVAERPAAFLAMFRPLADALFERLRWEDQEFYPKVFGRRQMQA